MKKIKLIIREKNVIFGLLLVIFVVGFFPNIKFNSDSLSHGNVKIENRVAADTITDVAEKETVTINFYDSVNRNSKVQSSETMTVNVGEYVWPVNLGDTADQSLKNVYHMYQIPQIANYTYQSSSQSSPLLVTDNPANNVINLYYKNDKQQSQVTINFFNSENQSSKVQDSETMTVNVGEYVWAVDFGAMANQSLSNVYHMYQIPQIANYTYQSSSQSTALLVTDNPANNVINLYYKRDKSQVTINYLDSDSGKSISPSKNVDVNVGDYVWIISFANKSTEQFKMGIYWCVAPPITGYSFDHGTPIKVKENPEENVVNLYYNADPLLAKYTFNYEYAKDTPDRSEALPPSQIVEKGDSVSSKLPYGYSISEVVNVDDESESYSSLEESLENQNGSESKTFRVIVSANKSSLKLTVHEPNGEIKIEDFSGLYGATYQLPIEKNLIFNGKIYHAIITITKRDWRMGTSISLAQSPDEIASLLKDNILVGKYDSSVISIDVSYKEEGIVPIPPSDGGDNSSSSTQSSEKTADKTDIEKNNEDKIVSSTTTPPPASKEKESSVEKKKEVEQVHSENKVVPKKEIKVPLAPPTPSFSTAEKVIASPSVTSEINQEAHILKMRIAGAAGLATGTVSAYGILRALKMMIQHFGKLGKF
ncbi:MAG: hypothetical protein LBH89_02550 [Lactococcus lactis]|jgi:hypothetical protein|nr:hypothetical protein [Lactococcus lactis]